MLIHASNGFRAHIPCAGHIDGEDPLVCCIRRHLALGRADASAIDETVKASRDGINESLAVRSAADVQASGKMNICLALQLRRSLLRNVGDVDGRTFPCQSPCHGEANSRGTTLAQGDSLATGIKTPKVGQGQKQWTERRESRWTEREGEQTLGLVPEGAHTVTAMVYPANEIPSVDMAA